MDGRFVSYLRVSTDRQGKSGLGLSGQREAVARHLNGGDWTLSGEYVETESGRQNARPQLAAALAHCRLIRATLIVAKLDRLSRNQSFLMSVVEGTGDGGVLFCDLPNIPSGPVGKFLLQQMAAVAELEAGLISQRTKAALAQSKKKLGGYRGAPPPDAALASQARTKAAAAYARQVGPIAARLRADGLSLRAIAAELTTMGVHTPRGRAWTATGVLNVLAAHTASSAPL